MKSIHLEYFQIWGKKCRNCFIRHEVRKGNLEDLGHIQLCFKEDFNMFKLFNTPSIYSGFQTLESQGSYSFLYPELTIHRAPYWSL